MKIVLAPDSFKGSLSAVEASEAMKEGILAVDRDVEIVQVPMADGGEGTTDNVIQAFGGREEYVEIVDPVGKLVTAKYGIFSENKCVIEAAESSGIMLLKPEEMNPLRTTTFGLGQMIRDALDKGCKTFVIGLGGSATNDGGAGMAMALGYGLLDENGCKIPYGGGALSKLAHITTDNVEQRIFQSDFLIACDVKNPLCGENGASFVFGPQKGADAEAVKLLDHNLKRFASVIEKDLGKSIADIPGAGAAGGLGAGTVAFLDGKLAEGVNIIAELSGLDEKMLGADLVITGEGKCDSQTINGKTPFGVASLARKNNIPVYIIAGYAGEGAEALYEYGVKEIYGIKTDEMTVEYSLANAAKLLTRTTAKAYREFLQTI